MTRTLTTGYEKNRIAERWCRERGIKLHNHRCVDTALTTCVDVICSDEQWRKLLSYVRTH